MTRMPADPCLRAFVMYTTSMMKIRKGIRGIQKIKANDLCGWHVFADDKYITYSVYSFGTTVIKMSLEGYILIDVTGNGLIFEKE